VHWLASQFCEAPSFCARLLPNLISLFLMILCNPPSDPEIQAIVRDPTISKVLQDMQNSPQTAQAAMRDPHIRKQIEKLIAAGVLGVK
jgi:hypothetical protein